MATITHHQWVQMHLKQMRAERRQRKTLIFGSGARNRARLREEKGERILYGPTGQPVRVLEYDGGNQVEERGDKLHAVIRPRARFKMRSVEE